MTTVAQAQAAIRTRLEANFTAIPLRWKNETAPLPDTPAAFAFIELIVENMGIVAFGGGRGANLQRTEGRIEAHVMVPVQSTVGQGVDQGFQWAEQIAAVFRSFRDTDISCFAAEAFPENGRSEDGNYDICATVVVDLHFDKIG